MPKASPKTVSNQKRRAPAGVLTRTPLSLRLLPEELAVVKAGALKEQRTSSSFARLLVLYGLKAYRGGKSIC